jgi:glycosyltransferase involved in cell wall biosynthesis
VIENSGAYYPREYVFLSLEGNKFSRSKNYHNGLLKQGLISHWVNIDSRHKLSQLLKCRNRFINKRVFYVVASPSHILVPYARLVLRQDIYLDAGWPLYEGVVLSRRNYGFLAWRAITTYFIDLLAFQLASKIFLETPNQVSFCQTRYALKSKKMSELPTGFDENRAKKVKNMPSKQHNKVEILFRGGAQEEAGLEILFEAFKLLKSNNNIVLRVASQGLKNNYSDRDNLIIHSKFLPEDKLWQFYNRADIVLGQLSNHERLLRTLPHKFYEASFFGKCYLTANKGEVAKYVSRGLVAGFVAGDSESLAQQIVFLAQSPKSRRQLSSKLQSEYFNTLSQGVLSKEFHKIINL